MNNEDLFDEDGKAIQAALELIQTILTVDPTVYDEIAAPVILFLRQRLQSSWRDK